VRKGGVACSRLYNSVRLLARAPAYRFVLGRNIEKNRQTLLDFIRQINRFRSSDSRRLVVSGAAGHDRHETFKSD
jgi:hypothetical protein